VQEPHRYYCPDGLHPSGEGYALWFATLVAQVPLTRFLAGPTDSFAPGEDRLDLVHDAVHSLHQRFVGLLRREVTPAAFTRLCG
jgi:hypothetical protein